MRLHRIRGARLLALLAVAVTAVVVSSLPASASLLAQPPSATVGHLPLRNSTLRLVSTGLYLDAYEDTTHGYGAVSRGDQENDTQRWIIHSIGTNREVTITQVSTGRRLGLSGSTMDPLVSTFPGTDPVTQSTTWRMTRQPDLDVYGLPAYEITNFSGCTLSAYANSGNDYRANCNLSAVGLTDRIWLTE
jgi:hypothetical protein